MISEFIKLFRGNRSSYGQWNPASGKMHTEKSEPTEKAFNRHLNGEYGIGVVPIDEDHNCYWGAIDIDCHGEDPIPIDVVAKTIYIKGLPLVACRSKSGGVHCYLFSSEPIPAFMMRRLLSKWAGTIGYGGSEIFPKQSELLDNHLGNWINLPYFGGDDTTRYAIDIHNNKPVKLTLEWFIRIAGEKTLNLETLKSFIIAGHEEAPPCIQGMLINGVPRGYRNEAVYAFTIYMRKRYSSNEYREKILEINQEVFDKPLKVSEVTRTVKSASRRDYKYKCQEEPCRSLCDSKECLGKEYGIEPGEPGELGDNMPNFNSLKVINTEPPLWELTVNDTPIVVTTSKLRNFNLLAEEIMEKLFIVVPIIKQKDWMYTLAGLMEKVEHIQVPDNASISGLIREKLIEFLSRADLHSNGRDPRDRELIERGFPVVQEDGNGTGRRVVVFRGGDFVTYLKRIRSEEIKGSGLWVALRKMGITYGRCRVGGGRIVNVWKVPIDGKGRTKIEPDYNPDSIFIEGKEDKKVKIISNLNF